MDGLGKKVDEMEETRAGKRRERKRRGCGERRELCVYVHAKVRTPPFLELSHHKISSCFTM